MAQISLIGGVHAVLALAWSVSAAMTVLVTAIGYILIEHQRPPPDSVTAAGGTMVPREDIAS